VLLKGIDPNQKLLEMPTAVLGEGAGQRGQSLFSGAEKGTVPLLIGSRMAQSTGLREGDYVTVQWRDASGMFDAREAHIVKVMATSVQDVDNGQLWLPLATLQELTNQPGQATYAVLARDAKLSWDMTNGFQDDNGWRFHDREFLLKDLRAVIKAKSAGTSGFYVVLLLLAMLAIFDTQVLSLFRRRKEMGTLMALGMTRGQVIRLFTLEGALNGVLAALLGAAYGIPLLGWLAHSGIAMPKMVDSMGFAVGESLYPAYSTALVTGTTVLVLVITTIVSYMPTRRIAKLKPTDALRGRWT
jgi:putative ABC transport system permease protein